jgi:outer membrane protein TolC
MNARGLACAVILLAGAGAIGQEVEPLPSPLRLDEALAIARSHRAEIAAARAKARAAGERPAIVSALDDPILTQSLDHLPFMLNGADLSLSIEQSFPLSRIRGHRGHAAQAEAERTRTEADRVELDVELDAANAYLMLYERREMAGILAQQRALAGELVTAALARYSSGTGNQADVLRAQTEAARLDGALRAIAAEIRGAEAMLDASLGRPATAAVPVLDVAPLVAEPPTVQVARDAAFANRPELEGGRAEIGRAQEEVAVMRSMYAPMAMMRTGPAYTMQDGAGWMLMVGLTLPVQRGRLRAGVGEANAMVDMARADLEAMRRMVDGEVTASREQVIAARERFVALHDQVVPKARQAIDPSLAGYSSGQLPLVSVIEAADALWSAEAEQVMAQASLGTAWARFHRAMGAPVGGRRRQP